MNKKEISGKFILPHKTVFTNMIQKALCESICNADCYIKEVIYNNPYTIVFWDDGTKTYSKVYGEDKYNCEMGLLNCIMKKMYGRDLVVNTLHDWVPESCDSFTKVTLKDVRKKHKEK